MAHITASLALQHILQYFSSQNASETSPKVRFIGIAGPQGIGKTTLSRALVAALSSKPHSLRVAAFSIDDLMYGRDAVSAIAQAHPENALLQGRGLPGTHDIELGAGTLMGLSLMGRSGEENGTDTLRLPVFNKGLHDGLGDMLPRDDWPIIHSPIDVVILDGWLLGCYPAPFDQLVKRWEKRTELGMPASVHLRDDMQDIHDINENLRRYADAWYGYFTCFIQISPPLSEGYEVVYKGRLQQEHCMKAQNGGMGLTDEQVIRLVDRFIPGYIFFNGPSAHTSDSPTQTWRGNGLKILVDSNRDPVGTQQF